MILRLPNELKKGKKFLYYALNSVDRSKIVTGSAQPQVTINNAVELQLPLPPLNEQHRIVNKIEELFTKLDAGVASLKKAQQLLKQYRQSVLKAAFEGKLTEEWRASNETEPLTIENSDISQIDHKIEIVELPFSWRNVFIGDIAEVKGGKRLPKGKKFSEVETSHPYIRVVDFEELSINREGLQYIDEEIFSQISRYIISSDDVYISIAGTIGRVGTIPDELDGANLTENAAKITDIKCFDKSFLAYQLNSETCQSQIRQLTVATSQPKLALFRIKSICVLLPPIEEQEEILNQIDLHMSRIKAIATDLNKELLKTESLKQSILKSAFSGNLVPQDPNDEPASILLERIKQEKAKLEAEMKAKKKRAKAKK